jgi:hydroxyacylglutathione hydrolase
MGEETVLVCTGDTLFVGDVGRTDFGGPELQGKWSKNLYESIFNKLMPLGDHVVLCPAHGSGSVCGGGIADRELSTLGLERLMNPMLQMSKEEFIRYKTEEHHEHAPYFKRMEVYNVEGAPFVGCGPNPRSLKTMEFKEILKKGARVVDTRPPPAFGVGHIKGSYSIYLNRLGMGGWVLPYDKPLLLVIGDQTHLDYVSRSLLRLGYDNVEGYLAGTISSWYKEVLPVVKLGMLTVMELKEKMDREDVFVLDVRSKGEYDESHIPESVNVYVGLLDKHLDKVPKDRPVAVLCKSGTRSSFGSSILLRAGYNNVYNVLGGMSSWEKAGYPSHR